MSDHAPLPLEGITVVEVGHSFAAPFAGMVFGALGARVIKVENPGAGDHARGWGPPFWDGAATAFHAVNRDKQGVTVDFRNPAEVAALRRLVLEEADVFIQNLKAGAIERHGLGADELRRLKPELIACNIGAFGRDGPLRDKPGYDPLMQAFSGIMSVTGEHERPPVRVGVSLVDFGTGLWSVVGILVALLERMKTRRGMTVDTALFETAVSWMTVPMAAFAGSGEVRKPHGSGVAEIVPYQAFETADGWLMVAAGNDGLFARLCGALGRPDLAQDPRFRRNGDRVVHRATLLPLLAALIAPWRRADLAAVLDREGIPSSAIHSVADLAAHPQLAASGIVQDGPPGALPTVGLPLRLDGRRAPYGRRAPELGEHNGEVLRRPEAAE